MKNYQSVTQENAQEVYNAVMNAKRAMEKLAQGKEFTNDERVAFRGQYELLLKDLREAMTLLGKKISN